MIHKGATKKGTHAYAARFEELPGGHFREALGLTVSSVGLGTYLGRDDDAGDRAYGEAIVTAVSSGVNVLDTAINYRLERSERTIARALSRLVEGGWKREGILLASKCGYIPSRDPQ